MLTLSDYKYARGQLIDNSVIKARSVMSLIDKDLSTIEATLHTLAMSPSLGANDLALLYRHAKGVLGAHAFYNIIVTDLSGRQLVNTRYPYDAAIAAMREPVNGTALNDRSTASISSIFADNNAEKLGHVVSVPIKKNGQTLYNLRAVITPEQMASLVKRQQLPSGWIVSVVDGHDRIVARSHEMRRFLGKKVSPALSAAKTFRNEGSFESTTREGVPVLSIFSRSPGSDWSLAIGIPIQLLTADLQQRLRQLLFGVIALLGCSMALTWFIARKIARSVRGLVTPALALGEAKEVIVPELCLFEANEVAKVLKQASVMLRHSRYKAAHDSLTGLANRGHFEEGIHDQLVICKKNSIPMSVLYLDLDGFKCVNDIHGHAAGDQLLCEVSARLRSGIRTLDFAARLGGDEFAVVLSGTSVEVAVQVAEKLVALLSAAYLVGGRSVHISVSIGVAGYPQCSETGLDLLHLADIAMYRAKAAGKRQVGLVPIRNLQKRFLSEAG